MEYTSPEDTIDDFHSFLGLAMDGAALTWKWKDTEKIVTETFLGKSNAFISILQTGEKLKGLEAPVLITGESGTGKELLAHFLHEQELSRNPCRPFVAINCGAIPDPLIESELFGHEKGAFTGAFEQKVGLFEKADGGDIFLDEISSLNPSLQVKLLRVLQDKKVRRVGGKEEKTLQFRVIAASNENLEELVHKNLFRLDLYHRLCVIQLHMPPLRERMDDLVLLARHFLKKFETETGRALSITPQAFEELKQHPWPGNIRQLENFIHRLAILSDQIITEKQIRLALATNGNGGNGVGQNLAFKSNSHDGLKEKLGFSEKDHIEKMLDQCDWNIRKTARGLQISRTTLYRKIESYQLFKK